MKRILALLLICSGSLAECWLLAGGKITAVTREAVTDLKLMKIFTDITRRSDLYEANAASLQHQIEALN